MGRGRAIRRMIVAMLLATAAGACSNDDDKTEATDNVTVGVFAASSLTESFTELGDMFEASRKGVTVSFEFGASSTLAEQIRQGAPGDAFASADEVNMAKVVDADLADGRPSVFARNRLAIVVAEGNPKAIKGLPDLARPGLVVVRCAPETPCGRLAVAALAQHGVTVQPASLEQNVKAVTTKVVLGEADAGIVYETDVKAAGTKVAGVAVEGADDPELQAVYTIAPLTSAPASHRRVAQAWAKFVRSAEAQEVLARYGFRGP